jgi:hypothetical protein
LQLRFLHYFCNHQIVLVGLSAQVLVLLVLVLPLVVEEALVNPNYRLNHQALTRTVER